MEVGLGSSHFHISDLSSKYNISSKIKSVLLSTVFTESLCNYESL